MLRHPRPQPVHVVRHYLHHLPPLPRGVTPGTGHAEARDGNASIFSAAGAGRRDRRPVPPPRRWVGGCGPGEVSGPESRHDAAAAGRSGAARRARASGTHGSRPMGVVRLRSIRGVNFALTPSYVTSLPKTPPMLQKFASQLQHCNEQSSEMLVASCPAEELSTSAKAMAQITDL